MRRISILNFKGGTGKSSLTENLGHALALRGKQVLIVDVDRQRNASKTLLGEQKTPSLTQVFTHAIPLTQAIHHARENLDVVPADSDLDEASNRIQQTPLKGYYLLQKAIQHLTGYDYVIFDHAGAFTPIMAAALLASEEILIPCELESYSVQGLFDMFAKLQEALSEHTLRNAGIIPYNVDLRYGMARQYLKELRETFNGLVTAPIRTDATVPRAQSVRQTFFEYDARSRVAEDFKTLADDLIAENQEATL